jgi:cytolysin (calcineurin-like family phosphatase)
MIIMSDSQLYWRCARNSDCREILGIPQNADDKDISKADWERMGTLSNQWQTDSIKKTALEIDPNSFGGVIINGDLTAFGHDNEFNAYKSFYENLGLTVWPGLGNHDYANNVDDCFNNNCAIRMTKYLIDKVKRLNIARFHFSERTYFSFPSFKIEYKGSLGYSWDIGDYHFVQMNNYPSYQRSFEGWDIANFRLEQVVIEDAISWLDEDLGNLALEKPVVINMHDVGEHFNGDGLDRFKRVISKYNVVAIFAGHFHELAGFYYYFDTLGKKIPLFFSGSAEHNKYLKVDFSPQGLDVQIIDSRLGNNIRIGEVHVDL